MEDKDIAVFGSPGNSDSGSPPQLLGASLPQVGNVAPTVAEASAATATMTSPGSTAGGGGRGQGSFDLFGKKKRGRPRKYDSDGKLRMTTSYHGAPSSQQQPGFSLSPSSPPDFSSKRGRGRPPGSGNWQLLASLGQFQIYKFYFPPKLFLLLCLWDLGFQNFLLGIKGFA